MTLDTLSTHVADRLSENPTGPAASRVRKISIALHHTHLPLLHDAGVITYDPSERVVTSLNDERLDTLLETGRQVLDTLQKERRLE